MQQEQTKDNELVEFEVVNQAYRDQSNTTALNTDSKHDNLTGVHSASHFSALLDNNTSKILNRSHE